MSDEGLRGGIGVKDIARTIADNECGRVVVVIVVVVVVAVAAVVVGLN